MGITRSLGKQASKKSTVALLLESTEDDYSDGTNVKTVGIFPRTQVSQV